MGRAIALRHRATVDVAQLSGSESVLEIGCGHGLATRLVLDRLPHGRVVAVDRSHKMIAATRAACAEHVCSGRLVIHAAPVESIDFADERFARIIAINLNLDLRLGEAWPETLVRSLEEQGRIVLGFDAPPSGGSSTGFLSAARARLEEASFEVVLAEHEEDGRRVTTLVAQRRPRIGTA